MELKSIKIFLRVPQTQIKNVFSIFVLYISYKYCIVYILYDIIYMNFLQNNLVT